MRNERKNGRKERKKTKFGHGRRKESHWGRRVGEKSRNEPPLDGNQFRAAPTALKRINVACGKTLNSLWTAPKDTTNLCNLSEELRDGGFQIQGGLTVEHSTLLIVVDMRQLVFGVFGPTETKRSTASNSNCQNADEV